MMRIDSNGHVIISHPIFIRYWVRYTPNIKFDELAITIYYEAGTQALPQVKMDQHVHFFKMPV